MNNRSMLSTTNPLVHTMHNVIPHYNNNNQKQENVSTFHNNRSNYPALSRNRSISSSVNDNDSSNSTTSSSPMTTDMHSNNGKDELQHVPSIRSKYSDNPPDEVVRKEKKRERNRQAAQKCRTRKLKRIDELQKRVNELQNKNKDLSGVANCLKTDITRLERQLQDHHTQGCTLMNGSM
jgi:chromosome segregation ATPase